MSTIQDTDILLVNRGDKDYKVKAESLYEYFNPKVVVFHIINIQNVTGSPDPLQIKSSSNLIAENLTTGDKVEVPYLTNYDLVAGNEYLITMLDTNGNFKFLENTAYNWDFGPRCDTKLLTQLYYFCYKCTEFDGDLSNLDVSNVKDMLNAFAGDPWNKMKCTFKGVEKWDTSNVETLWNLAHDNIGLTDLTPFKDWDVSKCWSFLTMFMSMESLLSAKAVEGWNTKSAEDMNYMFQSNRNLTEVADFSQWCVPNIKQYNGFNRYCEAKVIEPCWGHCPRGENGTVDPCP